MSTYQIYYDELKGDANEFGGQIVILGGVMESLFLEVGDIPIRTLLRRMREDVLLDTSNYHMGDDLYNAENRAAIRLVKDECAGVNDSFI